MLFALGNPSQFAALIPSEIAKWAVPVKLAGCRPNDSNWLRSLKLKIKP